MMKKMLAAVTIAFLLSSMLDAQSSNACASTASPAPADMVLVPAGELKENAIPSASGPVRVNPFLIEKHEVTNAQYGRFVKETGYRSEGDWTKYADGNTQDFPVRGVTVRDAQAYAAFVKRRLPAEEEWRLCESFPSEGGKQKAGYASSDMALGPRPSGSETPNALGLYDLDGNVAEWCLSYPSQGEGKRIGRVLGNSYFHKENRSKVQTLPLFLCGFRCAADPGQDKTDPAKVRASKASDKAAPIAAASDSVNGGRNEKPVLSAAQAARKNKSGLSLAGSNTLQVNGGGSRGTEVSDRTDFALQWGNLRTGLLSELSKGGSSTEGRGNEKLSELYVEWKDGFLKDNLAMDLRGGTVNNFSAASGLLLGSLRYNGFLVKLDHKRFLNFAAFGGKARTWRPSLSARDKRPYGYEDPEWTDPGIVESGRFGGLRVSRTLFDQLGLGFTCVGLLPDEGGRRTSLGVDYSLENRYIRSSAEYVNMGSGQRGFYLHTRSDYFGPFAFTFDYRNYKNLAIPINNPPIYTGISGGDDEDEIGYFLGMEVNPWKTTSFGISMNRSSHQDGSQAMTDLMFLIRHRLLKGLSLEYNLERERAEDGLTNIHAAMVNYSAKGGMRLSFRYTFDSGPDRFLRTIRATLRYPFFKAKFTPFLGYTWSREEASTRNMPQLGFTLRFWKRHYMTLRYTRSEQGNGGLNVTLFTEF